ncbi:MAG TPA: D-alanyl-D-alanine carboxypeptidase [Candidatus Eisenbergiella merdipullorum]|uniref:D-alanyl-D-alanine carboxypeptidase n=1 Tax=Candidatus Eisenbergiella merdipullorum TaxID=2838553 RepID=A0A9D2I2M6_9FIRM|nr:D-alanyl-D-alanine carboxypeptidase [Candidatus Eisenbergiella merdipullorum]
MKYRCGFTITAVCLAVSLLAASMPMRTFAASLAAVETAENEMETEETGTEEVTIAFSDEETGAEAWPEGPSIAAPSGVLMEASTGTVLYDKNMHEQHYPASITKILTALLAIENCDMDEMVTVPHEAVYMEDKGSHIALDEGEQLTVEDCLYAILLASANDAAYALAVHIGGSIEGFADMMNERAQELGCQDSHFTNPHGLPDEDHVTSAYDMALITREALKYDIFRTISGTTFYEIQPSANQPDLIPMSHHHAMLLSGRYHYDGVFAGKNGYTTVAQNTLVTCAERNGMDLICVTMETQGKQVYADAAALFDYGFDHFKLVDIGQDASDSLTASIHARTGGVESGSVVTEEIPVQVEEDGYAVLPDTAVLGDIQPDLYYDTENAREGARATLEYSYAGRTVGQAEIILPASLVIPEETEIPAETEPVQEPVRQEKSSFPWLYLILGIVGAAALAGGGYLLVRRQIWKSRWRRRRYSGKDQVYRRHVRQNNVYHVQARRRRGWKR